MRTLRYVVADVFTDTPLEGNQLAVFTDGREVDGDLMQRLALEIGFSETVFVLPAEAEGHARIRIFTPGLELPFAGHPTLGTAFVLGAPLQLGVIRLETGAGIVPVELERDSSGRIVFGRMQQPVPRVEEVEDTASDTAALGELGVVGVNCFAGSGTRWKTRMFSAADGVGEDAATGSAAGPLACHLARHGLIEWGTQIEITQGVEIGRPSRLTARAEGSDGLIDVVECGGSAVIVARGEFRL